MFHTKRSSASIANFYKTNIVAFVLMSVVIVLLFSLQDAHAQVVSRAVPDFVTHVDSAFSIHVPDYMVEVSAQDSESVQFHNIFNDTHLIIASETKQLLDPIDLSDLQDRFEKAMFQKGAFVSVHDDGHINTCSYILSEVQWQVDGSPVAYIAVFVDTPRAFYKIYGWTAATQKQYLEDFRTAALSFSLNRGAYQSPYVN